jgi:hypothetical protein
LERAEVVRLDKAPEALVLLGMLGLLELESEAVAADAVATIVEVEAVAAAWLP